MTADAVEESSELEPVVMVAIGGAVGVVLLVVAVVLLLVMRSKKRRERAHCGNGDRFHAKPAVDLAQHIAVQSSVAASRQIATADLGQQAEAQTV